VKSLRPVQIWVAPEFKTLINVESAKKNMSIIDYSRSLARNKSLLQEEREEPLNNTERRRPGFGWKI